MTWQLAVLLLSTVLAVAAVPVAIGSGDPAGRVGARDVATSTARGARLAAGGALALVVLAATGWLLPAALAGLGGWLAVRHQQRRRARPVRDVELTEALAPWIENLRDVLIAGDQPIGAIGSTVSSCPPVLRPHVRRLATRLARLEPSVAFRRFADDIDDPLGDLVAAGLLTAVERGARTVGVLTALAAQARSQADRRRIVEAERAPVRREVAVLTTIMASLLLGLFVFGRSRYLAPYDTAGGQLFLSVCLVIYGLLLARVQQLADHPRPARFLTMRAAGGPR